MGAVFEGSQLFTGQGRIQDMNFAFLLQLQKGGRQDGLQGWKIPDGCRKDDGIKGKPLYNTRIEIPAHELEVGLVTKDPCGLLQHLEVSVETQDAMAGDGSQVMGEPSVAAADLQDAEGLPGKGKMAHELLAGSFTKLPVFVLRVIF